MKIVSSTFRDLIFGCNFKKLESLHLLTFFSLACITGCTTAYDVRELTEQELAGVRQTIKLVATDGQCYPRSVSANVSTALDACLSQGQIRIGDIPGTPLACVELSSGDMYLDHRKSYDSIRMNRFLDERMNAYSVLFHEGVHLLQLDRDMTVEEMEEEAHFETHAFQKRLVADALVKKRYADFFPNDNPIRILESVANVRSMVAGHVGAIGPSGKIKLAKESWEANSQSWIQVDLPIQWISASAISQSQESAMRLSINSTPKIEIGSPRSRGTSRFLAAPPDSNHLLDASLARLDSLSTARQVVIGWYYLEGPNGPEDLDRLNSGPSQTTIVQFRENLVDLKIKLPEPGTWKLAFQPTLLFRLN